MRSLKFYYKNNFCPSLHAFKINWIGLFYFKLNSRKWENSLRVFQRNSPKYSNDQRVKLDCNWLKFYAEKKTRLRAITVPNGKQQTFTTSKHAIELSYSDFPCHFKVNRDRLALTNRRLMCKRRQKIDDYHREPEHFIGYEIKCTIIYLCPCVVFSCLEGIWMMRRRFTFPNISRAGL